jgi:hypothetical protein
VTARGMMLFDLESLLPSLHAPFTKALSKIYLELLFYLKTSCSHLAKRRET